jgi:hypothetical protein
MVSLARLLNIFGNVKGFGRTRPRQSAVSWTASSISFTNPVA